MTNEISTYFHDGMEIPFEDWSKKLHSFNDLTSIIQTTHDAAQSSAVKAINRMQTMRNWLIGYYIVEYEQHGKDRAEYGTQLLKKLEHIGGNKKLVIHASKSILHHFLSLTSAKKNTDRRIVSWLHFVLAVMRYVCI